MSSLEAITNDKGIFTIAALDQRGSLRKMINADNPEMVSFEEMVKIKRKQVKSLENLASAVLLDPDFGIKGVLSNHHLPEHVELLVCLEKSGYLGSAERREIVLSEDWTVSRIKKLGAMAVKLLLYYHPGQKEMAAKQRNLVTKVAEKCRDQDILFLLEPMSYPIRKGVIKKSAQFAKNKFEIVLETVKDLSGLGADVLKLEFPDEMGFTEDEGKMADHCWQISQASSEPWVLLSAGVSYLEIKKQLEIACRNGASGFAIGRAVWQEFKNCRTEAEEDNFFKTVAVTRFKELVTIANQWAKPWHKS